MILRTVASCVLLAALLVSAPARAVDDIETVWVGWFNTVKLDDRTSIMSDVQLRSSDNWANVRNVVARAAVMRTLRPGVSLGIGYANNRTVNLGGPDLTEHRIFEQLIVQRPLGKRSLTHRLRLEQRFIDRASGGDVYSDRLRYSARLMMPISPPSSGAFSRGGYVALQNEVFFHLSGRDELTGRFFDQNRAYVGVGRRLNAGLDLELGYLNQYVVGRNTDTRNHIVQFGLHTRW